MPCHFSGLFYVAQFKDNKLLCLFKDENGDVHQIDMIYYFPATVDRPFPQAYEAIRAGHIYFIMGSMAFHDKDLIVSLFDVFNHADLLKMNPIFVYRQGIYTDIDLPPTIIETLPQALSNMFLTVIGTAKVTQGITALSALKDDFPSWKYFIGEFTQFIDGDEQVYIYLFLNIVLSIDVSDILRQACS